MALSALTTIITHTAILSHSLSHATATLNHIILYATTNGHGYTLTVTQLTIKVNELS